MMGRSDRGDSCPQRLTAKKGGGILGTHDFILCWRHSDGSSLTTQ